MVSIIIPVYNKHEMTMECITSIRMNTEDCEIIVIDNGSDPPFEKPYTGFIDCRVIRNDENKGYPVAINQGLSEAKGDIIILLNNDTIVTPGWTESLIEALDEFDIVGPVMNFCAGIQKVQADAYEDIEQLNQSAADWAESYREAIIEVNFIMGACMAFKKTLFQEIGEFDEGIWPCSGEDIDFCFRAREKGYRVGIVQECYIHHEGSKTFEEMQDNGDIDYNDTVIASDNHLKEKWGEDFWYRQRIDSSPRAQGICLNLGCGYHKLKDFINIDNREEVKPDVVCNVIDGLPYPDNTIDMVRADDFLEHIPIGKTIDVVTEIWRVLKPDGIFESLTPSTDGRGAFQDPTHVSFWNRNSWLYYSDPDHRSLYGIQADFKIESISDNEPDPNWGIIHTHVIARKR